MPSQAVEQIGTTRRTGGVMLCIGALSVVLTSLCYGLAPLAGAMPVAPLYVSAAMDGAQLGQPMLRLIALIGTPGDVVTAAGAMLLAMVHARLEEGMRAFGFVLLGFSSFFFLLIDLLAGTALPILADMRATDAFHALKLLFDVAFMGGVVCLGLGCLAYAQPGVARHWRSLDGVIFAIGLAGVIAGMAALQGANVPHPMGLSVAFGAAAFAWVGFREAMSSA